jgi:hypothetical protein
MREALRIFRLTLIVKIAFFGLGSLVTAGLGLSVQLALLRRAAPTLLLALLVLPPWLERALGRRFLALGLGLDVLTESLFAAPFFFERRPFWLQNPDLSEPIIRQLPR